MHQRSGYHQMLLSLLWDNERNNVLHLAGYQARQHVLNLSSGAVLLMQRVYGNNFLSLICSEVLYFSTFQSLLLVNPADTKHLHYMSYKG